jgi:hypothetical protein
MGATSDEAAAVSDGHDDNQCHHARLSWPLVTSTREGLRQDSTEANA